MEGLVSLLVCGLVGSIVFLLGAERSRARARVWREAARAVGLTEVRETERLGIWRTLTGTVSGLRVRLERYQRGRHESGTRVTVGPFGHGPYGFSLRREGFGTSVEKTLGEREIEIGDAAFDEDLYVQGQVPLARALLDAKTRRRLRTLFRGEAWSGKPSDVRVRVSGDLLQVEIRERPFGAGPPLSDALARILAVSRRLVAPPDVAARLATSLSGEPEARVRLESLLTLVREFPDHPATREALLAARTDASEEVRLRAGAALGPEGHDCLLDLASDGAVDDSRAARAVGALGEHLGRARAEEILSRALRRARFATAVACLETLGRWGGRNAVPCLVRVLAAEKGEVGRAAAEALGATGAVAAEAPLLAALAGEAVELQVASARALGRVGTVCAVPSLREAAERSRDRELSRAVRQAVAEIQSRLRGAAPGQLSLSEGEGSVGRLSLAEESVEGRVSLAEGDKPASVSSPRARGREPA